jgi:predicted PurR-regulated permease PerM
VHPVITVLGVLIGLGLFGFIGLIFGPLLVSYIVVLFRIYMNEFTTVPDEKKTGRECCCYQRTEPLNMKFLSHF